MQIRKVCSNCYKSSLSLKYEFGEYSIVECKNCNFVFRDKVLSHKESESLYDKDYFLTLQKEYFLDCLTPNPEDRSRLEDFGSRLDLLQELLANKSRIKLLDLGAGTGAFAYLAEKRGWDTLSVEISDFASNIAKKKFKVKVHKGEIADKKFSDKNFDIVTMWESIANIEDTNTLFKKINMISKKDGHVALLTTVVDSWLYYIADFLYKVSFGKINYFIKEGYPIHHSNHFTRRNLKKTLKNNGYKVVYSSNVEIPYKYTKLPRIFFPILLVFGSFAKLTGTTIQVLIIAKKDLRLK